MKTVFFNDDRVPAGHYAATIGFFDGVHRGHRSLIGQLKQAARERGLQTMVITFAQHPRQVVQPEWQPQLLTTLEEKAHFIEETGIDVLVVLRFDRQMAALSAHDFMQRVLRDELGVQLLLTGYDNRFGHNREEGFQDYQRYGREMGIEVLCGQPYSEDGLRFSSSVVRQLIGDGRMAEAARCLGRPYTVTGRVVHGEQIGRTLGFPTANIRVEQAGRLLPANGVYAVSVRPAESEQTYSGVMNIGMRPTFSGHERTLEVNIFDFIGNLYDRQLTVAFIERLREERHFDSPAALTEQMKKDAEAAKRILKNC
ncbi:MAG: bifunctional riboflavin kinase/FAD synthetase [Prevotella sp.]|nr:bifunctional riboflavin kinase/FAD synthetase [Prevotella sp.]